MIVNGQQTTAFTATSPIHGQAFRPERSRSGHVLPRPHKQSVHPPRQNKGLKGARRSASLLATLPLEGSPSPPPLCENGSHKDYRPHPPACHPSQNQETRSVGV